MSHQQERRERIQAFFQRYHHRADQGQPRSGLSIHVDAANTQNLSEWAAMNLLLSTRDREQDEDELSLSQFVRFYLFMPLEGDQPPNLSKFVKDTLRPEVDEIIWDRLMTAIEDLMMAINNQTLNQFIGKMEQTRPDEVAIFVDDPKYLTRQEAKNIYENIYHCFRYLEEVRRYLRLLTVETAKDRRDGEKSDSEKIALYRKMHQMNRDLLFNRLVALKLIRNVSYTELQIDEDEDGE